MKILNKELVNLGFSTTVSIILFSIFNKNKKNLN